jgi:riboflavin kinase/FMN adenylyltransferase
MARSEFMKIFNCLDDIDKIPNVKIALGTFDGIHLGHRKIISQIVDAAKHDVGKSVVFTFSNHPLSVIDNEKCPVQIISLEDKEKLLAALGVDILCNIPFTEHLSNMSADEFINLLRQKFDLTHVVVGDNYRYGKNGQGTAALLKKAGEEHGFSVEVIGLATMNDPVAQEEIFISSSMVREFIREGKVSAAAFLLGRFFSISGKVINGESRGRVLGYPTANISLNQKLIVPSDGVYAVNVLIGENKYNGVANIGTNPTFNSGGRKLEVHILDFSKDLYGQDLTIEFVWRIRAEMAFDSSDELKSKIANDIVEARMVLNSELCEGPR